MKLKQAVNNRALSHEIERELEGSKIDGELNRNYVLRKPSRYSLKRLEVHSCECKSE